MKKLTACALAIVIVVIFAAPVWACGAGSTGKAPGSTTIFVVVNHDHTQRLGGKSLHAWHGLLQAALHSKAVQRIDPIGTIDPDDGSEMEVVPTGGSG